MNFFRVLFVGFIAIACSVPKESVYEKLQGHWHVIEPNHIYALDVTDSTATINQFSFLGETESHPLFYDSAKTKISLPDICKCQGIQRCVPSFHISNDTLYYDHRDKDECSILKLVKSDLAKCLWSHAVENTELDLTNLPIQRGKILNWDSVRNNSSVMVIKLGYPKPKYAHFSNLERIETYPDFILTHADTPQEMRFIQKVFVKRIESPGSICIVISQGIEKTVANNFVNGIERNENVNLLRLVKAKNSNEIGYELLNP